MKNNELIGSSYGSCSIGGVGSLGLRAADTGLTHYSYATGQCINPEHKQVTVPQFVQAVRRSVEDLGLKEVSTRLRIKAAQIQKWLNGLYDPPSRTDRRELYLKRLSKPAPPMT